MKTALWIVGEPGVGKTTLARNLFGASKLTIIDKPKWTVGENVCAAGHYKGESFDGADTVPYNGVEAALHYWISNLTIKELTIFDGDRFSFQRVLETFRLLIERTCCILLYGDETLISARRSARSEQDEIWVKGRITKAKNFSLLFEDRISINADFGEEIVFQEAIDFLSEAPRKEPIALKQKSLFG